MEDKKYTQPLLEVVELATNDIVTESLIGEENSGDNIYKYGDLFG